MFREIYKIFNLNANNKLGSFFYHYKVLESTNPYFFTPIKTNCKFVDSGLRFGSDEPDDFMVLAQIENTVQSRYSDNQ